MEITLNKNSNEVIYYVNCVILNFSYRNTSHRVSTQRIIYKFYSRADEINLINNNAQ